VSDDETEKLDCSPQRRRSPAVAHVHKIDSSPAPTALTGPKPPREAEALRLIDARKMREVRAMCGGLSPKVSINQRLLASDAQNERVPSRSGRRACINSQQCKPAEANRQVKYWSFR